jgi:hypothetical protein
MTENQASTDQVKTYFWMVHYDVSPVAPAGGLTPIAAGRKRGISVFVRSLYANHTFDFRMPRENEGASADPSHFRGSPDLRNRILGFYASAEEANAHIDILWPKMTGECGAIYAELHSLRLDVAQQLKLVA